MLMALLRSNQFHNNNAAAANDRKHWHLVLIIYLMILAQFFKLAFRIVVMVIMTIVSKDVDDCLDSSTKSQTYYYAVR